MTSSDMEWDENICQETTGTPDRPYARLTDRAEQECRKRFRAYLVVRSPQEKLDPRIIELATSGTMPLNAVPYLHYGLKVPFDAIEPCISRISIKVDLRGTSEYSERQDPVFALQAVQTFVQRKANLTINTAFALGERTDHVLFALDNTDILRHRKFSFFKERKDRALQVIRDVFDLGDQKAMWWWDAKYGLNYTSPIPDYNPPQINPKPKVSLIRRHIDFDSSDSDLDSDSSDSETD